MTPALLFALVDAVLSQRREASWRMRAWDSHKEQWAVARGQLGWWRSLWPLGGA